MKFRNFPATEILRENNCSEFIHSKTAFLTIQRLWIMIFSKFVHFYKAKIVKKSNSRVPEIAQISHFWGYLKVVLPLQIENFV